LKIEIFIDASDIVYIIIDDFGAELCNNLLKFAGVSNLGLY